MIFCRKEKREVHIVISNALKTKSLIVTLFMVSMVTNYVTFNYLLTSVYWKPLFVRMNVLRPCCLILYKEKYGKTKTIIPSTIFLLCNNQGEIEFKIHVI